MAGITKTDLAAQWREGFDCATGTMRKIFDEIIIGSRSGLPGLDAVIIAGRDKILAALAGERESHNEA